RTQVALGRRPRLALDLRQALVEARPAWRARGPDRHAGFDKLAVVERTRAHEDPMPVRHVAAVRGQTIVPQLTAHRQRLAGEAGVHGGAAGADVLADAAPAGAGDDGRCADRIEVAAAPAGTA